MYKKAKYNKSTIKSVEKLEGEPIEYKIERILNNNEPIKDGAPQIYTERNEGVISAYNIRADRWEIATEAMDYVSKSIQAKRENKGKLPETKETKVIDMKVDEVKPTQGTGE